MGVDHQQFAGTDPALFHCLVGSVIPDPYFRGQGDQTVAGDHITGRPQAVAVKPAGGKAAVAHDDAGGAVPGLHMHRVEIVERAQILVHLGMILPGRGDQQPKGPKQVHPASQEGFQHIIK